MEFLSKDFHGQKVRFSSDNTISKIALCSGQNYGIAGQGSLNIFQLDFENKVLNNHLRFFWKDVLMDVSWHPQEHHLVAGASGDGNIIIWNTLLAGRSPTTMKDQHQAEVSSVEWNPNGKNLLSASWDGTVKMWDAKSMRLASIFLGHSDIVFEARCSPLSVSTFASTSGDGKLLIWDSRYPPRFSLEHGCDILCCDWSPTNEHTLVSGSNDGNIRWWDIRQGSQPLHRFFGHELAVTDIRFTKDNTARFFSSSFDFTSRLWNQEQPNVCKIFCHHSEFVMGVDCHSNGWLSDCSWDGTMKIFHPDLIAKI